MVGTCLRDSAAEDVARPNDGDEGPGPHVVEGVRDGGCNEHRQDESEHRPELGGEKRPLRLVVGTGRALTHRLGLIAEVVSRCTSCCHVVHLLPSGTLLPPRGRSDKTFCSDLRSDCPGAAWPSQERQEGGFTSPTA